MTRMTVNEVQGEALFASRLQRSDAPTAEMVPEAIRATVRRLGAAGCLCQMAEEFGDHPEQAAERTRWASQLLAQALAAARAGPGGRAPVRSRKRAAGRDQHAARAHVHQECQA